MKHPFDYILTTRYKTRLIRNLIKDTNKQRVLDVGCGGGFILSKVGNLFDFAAGVDMSVEALQFGSAYTNASLNVANAEQLPFKNNSFDCIVSTDAFEHIPDDAAAMDEAFRVLKDSGYLIIYTPCTDGILSNTKMIDLYHQSEKSYLLDQRYYSMESLKELAQNSGFKVEYLGYHNVFFQELFTQLLKWVASKKGHKYENQGDIFGFTNSALFPVYKWFILPLISLAVRLEESVCENVFRARIPGHRIVMKCKKVSTLKP